MRTRGLFFLAGAFLVAMTLGGCKFGQSNNVNTDFDVPDSLLATSGAKSVDKDVLSEMVENIASPVETAALIKRLKVGFDKSILIPSEASKHFNTNYQKALGLGLFGTDLGYLNMYEKTSEVLTYISSVKELADGIQVGQFFDFGSLKRLASNNENLDSLIYISQKSYKDIDEYLRQNNRSNLSVVIVAGVWIEGMYLSSRVAEQTGSTEMIETILDQKIVIAKLLPMLRVYEEDPNIAGLAKELDVLKACYDQVKITYEQGEPVQKVVDGKLTFEQTDKQVVEASEDLKKDLMAKIVALRNKLITPQQ